MLPARGQANNVASSDAIALVIINNGENGEDLFRVAATLGVSSGVEQPPEEPKGPQSMATVSMSAVLLGSWRIISFCGVDDELVLLSINITSTYARAAPDPNVDP